MKIKLFALVMFIALLPTLAFSNNGMFFLSLEGGAVVNSYYDGNQTATNDLGGFNAAWYSFRPDYNLGSFYSLSLMTSEETIVDNNGSETTYDLSAYDSVLEFDNTFGMALKIELTPHFAILGGIGPAINIYYLSAEDWTETYVNLGLGSEVRVKYNLTPGLFISGGAILRYDVAEYYSYDIYGFEESDWNDDFDEAAAFTFLLGIGLSY